MFSRKWTIILPFAMALFAGCDGDSKLSSEALIPNTEEETVSNLPEAGDSSNVAADTIKTSSSSAKNSSSSSVENSSSSSAENSSSSSLCGVKKYLICKKAYTPPTVTFNSDCREAEYVTEAEYEKIKSFNAPELQDQLENNQTLTLDELNEIERNLATMSPCTNILVAIQVSHDPELQYLCNGDSTESSSTSDTDSGIEKPTPSPLCQKTDFEEGYSIQNHEFFEVLKTKRDSILETDDFTDAQTDCIFDMDVLELEACMEGGNLIARKQICDGDTTVNPRYQALLDSNEAFIDKQIEECLKSK